MIPKHLMLVSLLVLCCQDLSAQTGIKGVVIGADTKKPLASVSVYLNNTSIGTTTNDQGVFFLRDVPAGKFRLVASYVGYQSFQKLIDTRDISGELRIVLEPKSEQLQGVAVIPFNPQGWSEWNKLFTDIFIGTTENAERCQIKNPEVLRFRMNKKDNTLQVVADEPLLIINDALGYEVRYKIEDFEYDFNTKIVVYNGYAFFKDLAASDPKASRKWKQRRALTYQGSLLHFMRTFFTNKLESEGFEMHNLGYIVNAKKERGRERFRQHPGGPLLDTPFNRHEYLIDPNGKPIGILGNMQVLDSTDFYLKALKEPDSLISHRPIYADSIGFAVDSSTAGMYSADSMEVSYKGKEIPVGYRRLSRTHRFENYPVSQFVFVNRKPIFALANGYYYGPYDLKITGFWAWSENISTLLPYDYKQPPKN